MRKAINGLVTIVEAEMNLEPLSSRLFVFCNNNRTIVKCVYWEGNGFALWMKDDQVKPAPVSSKAKGGRRQLPAHLPRIEIKHTLDGEACLCEHCDQAMVPLSEKITEQLDIIPAKVRVLRHHRTTYHFPGCKDALKTAPLPPQPIPKSNASPSCVR